MSSKTAALTSLEEIERHMALLYAEAPDDAWIVASWIAGPNDFRSSWFLVTDRRKAAQFLREKAEHCNTYMGVGLRHPRCQPGESNRGASEDVFAIAGIWVEFDHNNGVHTAMNLPSPVELMAFIDQLPCRFSFMLDSGGGFHAYLLFKELWILDTPDEQKRAALLVKRLQRTLQEQASVKGWKIDGTADLARVLRPAGTVNHKGAVAKPVMEMINDPIRYGPAELDSMSWMAVIEDEYVDTVPAGGSIAASLAPIETGCAWMAHCRDDAATLQEPEWYAMLGILGRCQDGQRLAHEWSAPYPNYTTGETDRKLRHAIDAAKPRTCTHIRYDLGADAYCKACPSWKIIKSPVTLGSPKGSPDPFGFSTLNGTYSIPEATPEQIARVEALRRPLVALAPKAPPLPARAVAAPSGMQTWLDAYAAHSAYWAPRAAPSYHKAVGLWVLSTIAARRIAVEMGSTPIYPTLFLALVSESTHWTKTTAASLGVRLLRRAGCGHLLAPDRTTPQFLLKLMAGLVPQDYGTKDAFEQEQARNVLGFAAQRGWFYEEWGGMLTQMKRVDSPHAELNKLLIVLEGGAETFETGTIQRGLERIDAPYLALLGNATPHDLVPFMMEGNAWWHDGFWPRFACITPPHGQAPSRTARPREVYDLPGELIVPLHTWHMTLGNPVVTIEEERESNGKMTGKWVGKVGNFPRHVLTLAPAVYDAYEAYNDALLDVVHAGDVSPDLAPWYGRAHEKALRVAMLLASVHRQEEITLPFWREGQVTAEGWRQNLHELVGKVGENAPLNREAALEQKIEHVLVLAGAMTAREVQRHTHNVSSEFINKTLASMLKLGKVEAIKNGRKILYTIFNEEENHAQ